MYACQMRRPHQHKHATLGSAKVLSPLAHSPRKEAGADEGAASARHRTAAQAAGTAHLPQNDTKRVGVRVLAQLALRQQFRRLVASRAHARDPRDQLTARQLLGELKIGDLKGE